jgi:hypothetical protein
MKETMHELVAGMLVERGWEALVAPAVAKMYFETSVGKKEALTYMSDWGGASENWTLTGTYYSEGGNVLATAFVFIPKASTIEQVKALVDKYVANVEEAVNASYARLLWLRWEAPNAAEFRASQEQAKYSAL